MVGMAAILEIAFQANLSNNNYIILSRKEIIDYDRTYHRTQIGDL